MKKQIITLAGLILGLMMAVGCTTATAPPATSTPTPTATPTPPDKSEGILMGSVTIGPLCPVEPCSDLPVDTYSSRELLLRQQGNEPIRIRLGSDGSYSAVLPAGTYQVDLTDCNFLGCSRVFPKGVTVEDGETTALQIDVDTGIRTPSSPGHTTVSASADEAARHALGLRLGIAPEEPTLVNSEAAEFGNGGLGCPEPGVAYPAVIIIGGYRLVYEHEGMRYIYHVGSDGSLVTDCRRETVKAIPFRMAGDVVRVEDAFQFAEGGPSGLGREVVLRTVKDARDFQSEFHDSVAIDVDRIDWDTQMLVGTVIRGTGCSFDVWATGVTRDDFLKDVDIEVRAVQTGACEKAWAQPVWVIVGGIPSEYSAGFVLNFGIE